MFSIMDFTVDNAFWYALLLIAGIVVVMNAVCWSLKPLPKKQDVFSD